MNTDLTDKVALITGASQGIGEAIARSLHREGAKVALIAGAQAKLDAVARELGDRAFAVAADVLDAASLSAAIEAAEKRPSTTPAVSSRPTASCSARSRTYPMKTG